jgi:hypothetical protein
LRHSRSADALGLGHDPRDLRRILGSQLAANRSRQSCRTGHS